MKKFIVLIISIIIIILIYSSKNNYFKIPNEAIRFRIIANSNSPSDQLIKERLKKDIEPIIEKMLQNSNNIDDARINIINNMEELTNAIDEFLKNNGYNIDYRVNYGNNHFPKKIYKGTLYNEGDYESLVITLGNGEGDNWWCLLFPPICYMDFDDTEEVEYKFLIEQIFDKLK